ncbi:MAG: hypothetical protein KHX03_07990 [Clostridium sp.]|nr:hypothetical protein [Clostridium sp.]
MFQEVLQTNLQKILNFFGYLMAYFRRNNPLQAFLNQIVGMIKDYLTMNRKLKMAKYRVNYQMYKLNQMEQLIAENNEHVFLRGNKLNLQR